MSITNAQEKIQSINDRGARLAMKRWCDCYSPERATELAKHMPYYCTCSKLRNLKPLDDFWHLVITDSKYHFVQNVLRRNRCGGILKEKAQEIEWKATSRVLELISTTEGLHEGRGKSGLSKSATSSSSIIVPLNIFNIASVASMDDNTKGFIHSTNLKDLLAIKSPTPEIKHLAALKMILDYSTNVLPKGFLSKENQLLHDLNESTFLVYLNHNQPSVLNMVVKLNPKIMINYFPYGIDYQNCDETSVVFLDWLKSVSFDYLFGLNDINNLSYLIATKLLLEKDSIKKNPSVTETMLRRLINNAFEQGDYITLAQFIRMNNEGVFKKYRNIPYLIDSVSSEFKPYEIKPLNTYNPQFKNLYVNSQKPNPSREESLMLSSGRFVVFAAYGKPEEEYNRQMAILLRYNTVEDYLKFKDFFVKTRMSEDNNPSIKEWLNQKRLKRRKEVE